MDKRQALLVLLAFASTELKALEQAPAARQHADLPLDPATLAAALDEVTMNPRALFGQLDLSGVIPAELEEDVIEAPEILTTPPSMPAAPAPRTDLQSQAVQFTDPAMTDADDDQGVFVFPADTAKDEVIRWRLTSEEKTQIEQASKAAGYTYVSDYQRVLNGLPPERLPKRPIAISRKGRQ